MNETLEGGSTEDGLAPGWMWCEVVVVDEAAAAVPLALVSSKMRIDS